MIDVAIVGGGPAGLLTAAHLAQAGLDVVLLEEHPKIGEPVHCTGIISLETAELAKIPDDIVLGRLTRARLVGPRGGRAEHRWPEHGAEPILVIDRGRFDRSLARHAQDAGAFVRTGVRVQGVETDSHRVTLETSAERIAARACVLACGVSYRFQRRLGLGLPAQSIHTAQIEMDADPDDAVELHFGRDMSPSGFVWTVPVVRDGRARLKIGAMASGNAGACLDAFVARPEVRARLGDEPCRPIRRLLPLRPIARTYGDRVLVVGDAGGFTKPSTGGGIFYGLLTASLAATTLVEGFGRGRLDGAFLARYERRWQERLGADLRVADWLRQVVSRCSDEELDRLVRATAADDVRALIGRTTRFNWHRDVILALVFHPRIATQLFRTLLR